MAEIEIQLSEHQRRVPIIVAFSSISRDFISRCHSSSYERVGGSCIYVGSLLAALGVDVVPVGSIGCDLDLKEVLRAFEGSEASSHLQQSRCRSTHVHLKYKSEMLVDVRVRWGEPYNFTEEALAAIRGADYLHIGPETYENQLLAAEHAAKSKVPVLFDPHADYNEDGLERLSDLMRHVSIFFCNEAESAALTGTTDPVAASKAVLGLGVENFCLMKGNSGAIWIGRDGTIINVPAFITRRPADSVGAGDSFQAGFLFGQLIGMDLYSSLRAAAFIASRAIEERDSYGIYRINSLRLGPSIRGRAGE